MQWEAFGLRTQATGQRFFYAIIAIILLPLCGCGSIGGGKSATVSSPILKPALSGGGYYRNDGPEANPPAHLELVPDAQPKLEPVNPATSRPYTILGHEYIPMSALGPYRVRGVASWYGRRYHKQMTASGEFYDMYAMTAAHTTLPIPSYARVTRLSTGQSVVVRINDRGPFVDNRLIDLSYTAAFKLGILAGGNDVVEVESVVPGSTLARPVLPASGPAVATPSRTEVPTVAPARIAPPGSQRHRRPSAPGVELRPTGHGARELLSMGGHDWAELRLLRVGSAGLCPGRHLVAAGCLPSGTLLSARGSVP